MNRIYNFSPGPATLPLPVLEEAAQGVLELGDSGMSILELSHRGKQYEAIHFDAMERVLRVVGLSKDEYAVLFMTGGASQQFATLPMNFLNGHRTAEYVDTDDWSAKAIHEAQRYGGVHVPGTSKADNYDHLPSDMEFNESAKYLHYTTNNTIVGTQWAGDVPNPYNVPLIADMSSDIFAVTRDFSRYSLFYAGAQKNAGAAGVTFVAVRREFLQTAQTDLSPLFSYKNFAEKDSLYNTPPCFAIYVLGLTLKWLENEGGIAALEARNREKATLIYDALDAAPDFYRPAVPNPADRSVMNITFGLVNKGLEAELLKETQEHGMDGLKGHRSVGGLRVSIYNAFPREGCAALAELLADFALRKG